MFCVYIKYNDTNEIEKYDELETRNEAENIVRNLEAEDNRITKMGIPTMNCSYFIKEV